MFASIEMKVAVSIVVLATLVIVGWLSFGGNKAKNYEDATYTADGSYYEIAFKGLRYLMVHDPISWNGEYKLSSHGSIN